MELQTRRRRRIAVEGIPQHGVTEGRQMHPQLVGAAGAGLEKQKAGARP